jgi:hypothetical protein
LTLTRGAVNLGLADGGIADELLMQSYDAVIADCARVLAKYHDPKITLSCASAIKQRYYRMLFVARNCTILTLLCTTADHRDKFA